jgi:hypothetical protein
MRATRTLSLLFLFTAAVAADAGASEPGRLNLFGRHFSVVAGVKGFLPDSRATRDVFGGVQVGPDLRLWHFDQRQGPSFAYDLGYTRFKKENRSADFISTGLGVHFAGSPDQVVVPYWIVRAGPYFPKISNHGRQVTAGGNTELGLSIADRFVLAARYDLMGRVHGYRLSGYTARVGFTVF